MTTENKIPSKFMNEEGSFNEELFDLKFVEYCKQLCPNLTIDEYQCGVLLKTLRGKGGIPYLGRDLGRELFNLVLNEWCEHTSKQLYLLPSLTISKDKHKELMQIIKD